MTMTIFWLIFLIQFLSFKILIRIIRKRGKPENPLLQQDQQTVELGPLGLAQDKNALIYKFISLEKNLNIYRKYYNPEKGGY